MSEIKLRPANESVGWINSVGPLDVSPTGISPEQYRRYVTIYRTTGILSIRVTTRPPCGEAS